MNIFWGPLEGVTLGFGTKAMLAENRYLYLSQGFLYCFKFISLGVDLVGMKYKREKRE